PILEAAWIVISFSALVAGVSVAVAVFFLCRTMRRLREDVARLADSAEAALVPWQTVGERTADIAGLFHRSLMGFAALAEGGRMFGESVFRAARAVSRLIDGWIAAVPEPHAGRAEAERGRQAEPGLEEAGPGRAEAEPGMENAGTGQAEAESCLKEAGPGQTEGKPGPEEAEPGQAEAEPRPEAPGPGRAERDGSRGEQRA